MRRQPEGALASTAPGNVLAEAGSDDARQKHHASSLMTVSKHPKAGSLRLPTRYKRTEPEQGKPEVDLIQRSI